MNLFMMMQSIWLLKNIFLQIQSDEGRQVHECIAGDASDGLAVQIQSGKGGQVHECVAGDAADGIVIQIPTDESSLAGDWWNIKVCDKEGLWARYYHSTALLSPPMSPSLSTHSLPIETAV